MGTIARLGLLYIGEFCAIDLTQRIQTNVVRRVAVSSCRIYLRRGWPTLRVGKPTAGYVPHLADLRAATDC